MKTASFLSAAILSLVLCPPAGAGTHTNLFENFSNFDAAWGATANAYKLLNEVTDETAISGTDVSGWTGTGLVFQSPSSIRLGNGSKKGVVFSPVIRLSDKAITTGSATLSFHAARTASGVGVTTSPNVTVLNPDGTTVDGIAVYSPGRLGDASSMDSIDSCHTNTSGVAIEHVYTGLPNEFRLRFESSASSDGRVAIDAVLVVQDIRDTLDAPAGLALSGTAGTNGFTVTWGSVADAEGYSVKAVGPNDVVASSNDVVTTSATFAGLTSSTAYTVVVVALGDHATTDDSAPATCEVATAASAVAAPTLVVANKNWTAGVAGTSAVSALLEDDVACDFTSVEMSDGSTATVAGGILSWTPPVSATASTVTATFHVTHGSDGWDVSDTLSVAATPAPSAPNISFTGTTSKAFTASWTASDGGPVVSYKVRAWTGRSTPDDPTGSASENFAAYVTDGTVPAGWTFVNADAYTGSTYAAYPVGFKSVSGSAVSPDYGATLSSVSFRLRAGTGSFIVSAAPSGSDDWTVVTNYTSDAGTFTTELKTVALDASAGYSKIKLEFARTSGSAAFGTFTVSGTDWPAADFLEGWGGAKVSVGSATSQTFSDPVSGELNYVEVTAVGPAGATTSAIASVAVPGRPSVISVK